MAGWIIACAVFALLIGLLRPGAGDVRGTLPTVLDLRDAGRPDAAAALVGAELAKGKRYAWLVNLMVETLISAGRYRDALATPRDYTPWSGADGINEVLVHINLAEAEYNLGAWDAAWERLRRLDEYAAPAAITAAGLSLQRAWIAAHRGSAADALGHWQRSDMYGLPYRYRAEHYFTHAVVLLALGDLDEAEEAALAGADAAVRTSSERNALFLLARVAAAKADWLRAEALCRTAAEHRYRGQGGDGLLLWGDALARLGRMVEAKQAWSLASQRDPESESAAIAAKRSNGAA
jgi:tetratricopeptide (TPR) repeat protein